MVMDTPFAVILEGPIDNGDGKPRNPKKRFECTCKITLDEDDKPKLIITGVDDVTIESDKKPIEDEQDIPSVQSIVAAARMLEWSEEHKEIFTEARVYREPATNT